MQSNKILSKVILWVFPLYFPQVAGEQLITSMKDQLCVAHTTSLPSSTVDRSTGEDNIIMF